MICLTHYSLGSVCVDSDGKEVCRDHITEAELVVQPSLETSSLSQQPQQQKLATPPSESFGSDAACTEAGGADAVKIITHNSNSSRETVIIPLNQHQPQSPIQKSQQPEQQVPPSHAERI